MDLSRRDGVATVVSVGVSFASACVAFGLWRRVRTLEHALVQAEVKFETTTDQQRSVLEWLTQQIGTIAAAPAMAQPRPSASGVVVARQPSWDNMSSAASDVGGYRTAEEDADESAEVVQPSARRGRGGDDVARAPPPPRAAGSMASSDSPVEVQPPVEWGAQSLAGDSASWSCVQQVGASEGSGAAADSSPQAADEAARAAALKATLERADELYEKNEFEAAFELLAAQEETVDVLWRQCRVYKGLADQAKAAGDPKECERLSYQGLRAVEAALARDDTHFAVHKWYAIAVSTTSAYEGTKATITKSVVVREHFMRAAELNPHDATSRHALGMWYFEVASLSWAMRKIAAAVFASPPTGSYDEALAHFQLAESISPGFYMRNRLMIAKCQQQLRDRGAARQWATQALELQVCNLDDEGAAEEAKQLLASL